jgi:hypothetical protein
MGNYWSIHLPHLLEPNGTFNIQHYSGVRQPRKLDLPASCVGATRLPSAASP